MAHKIDTNIPVRLGNIYDNRFMGGFAGNVWDLNAISPTIMTMQGGGRQPMIIVKSNIKEVKDEKK